MKLLIVSPMVKEKNQCPVNKFSLMWVRLTKLEIYDPSTYPPCFDIGFLMIIWFICLFSMCKDCWAQELFGAGKKVLEKIHYSPQFVPNSCAIVYCLPSEELIFLIYKRRRWKNVFNLTECHHHLP